MWIVNLINEGKIYSKMGALKVIIKFGKFEFILGIKDLDFIC